MRAHGFLFLPLVFTAFLRPCAPQKDPREVERELYRAVKEGSPPSEVLEMARKAVERFPGRPYPLVILGDSYFRIRRLASAGRAYERALAAMGGEEKAGLLEKKVRENLSLLKSEMSGLERGLALEKRARWAGRGVLVLLAGLILFLARPVRGRPTSEPLRD